MSTDVGKQAQQPPAPMGRLGVLELKTVCDGGQRGDWSFGFLEAANTIGRFIFDRLDRPSATERTEHPGSC